ncbi:MAG: thioredoxin domain-containing protein [Acidobacteriaceae bacterium]|nr:thioredoxin domain-containing protein [Acidobacteriaceae bacterium]
MHTNALSREKSPYLRQHAHNPVDWLPWGEEAFEKARREDKPIFLSIGYSTCHWCHVMAHESFEDEAVAQVLNREFVPIKLDREERPDVDRIYMLFVQASTGSGGWPMSVFLTPALKPFFGGTYFPPDSLYGRPGFRDLLEYLARAWQQERERVESSGASVVEQLRSLSAPAPSNLPPTADLFASAFWQFRRSFDARWGGFGAAPKFPRPVVLNYLLRYYHSENNAEALDMVTKTLDAMSAGGMHDQLGGGFHRYSVDERWFVPHFEKMLYDQAQLAIAYLEAFEITRDPKCATVARGIFSYVLRDLTDATGAFFSAEDADSPDPENPSHSGEGAFYIWRKAEIDSLLGPEADPFDRTFGVEPGGNVDEDPHGEFSGRNILYLAQPEHAQRFPSAKEKLFEARSRRPRPHLDRKVLTSWNGLMISAFARGYAVLRDEQYLDAARRAVAFFLDSMYNPSTGELQRRFCDGEAAVPAFLDDYAMLATALLDLFETVFDPQYLQTAVALTRAAIARFEDRAAGGFFSTEERAADLLLRMKDDYDGAEPSGNSVMTDLLLRLAHLTGDDVFRASAERSLAVFAPKIKAQPAIAPQMLVALGRSLAEPEQLVIRCPSIGPEVAEILNKHRAKFSPYSVFLGISDAAAASLAPVAPFLAGLERRGRLTLYRCKNFSCDLPQVIG